MLTLEPNPVCNQGTGTFCSEDCTTIAAMVPGPSPAA